MASGIIYVAIVGMWLAYFVPRWVHNHDEFSGKSVERYKSALRFVASGAGSDAEANSRGHGDTDQESRGAKVLLRRRIVFAALALALLGALVDVIFYSAPFAYSLLPMTGFAIYIGRVRRQGSAQRLQRRRVTQLQRTSAGVSSTNLAQVLAPKSTGEHWIPIQERQLTGVVLLPKGSTKERNSWQPNHVPLPTYVTAPKAVVPQRTIDLTVPGVWSDEQERLARAALEMAAPSRDEIFDQQLAEEAIERVRHNRAANE